MSNLDFLSDLGFWQWVVVIAVVAVALWASARNRTIYAKLGVMLGIVLLVVLQLGKAVPEKETLVDANIRQLCAKLEGDALRPDVAKAAPKMAATLKELAALNLGRDRDDRAKGEKLLKELEGYPCPADFVKQRIDELCASWRARLANSKESIREQLAQLRAKPSLTPEEQARAAQLESMVPAWYDRLPLKFGLDLRGGTEMRLRLRPDTTRLDKFTAERDKAREELEKTDKADKAKLEAAEKSLAQKEKKVEDEKAVLADNFRNASNVIRNRLNSSGLEEISVTVQGNDKLLVQIPGMSSDGAQGIIDRVKRMGQLEFRIAMDGIDNELVQEVSTHSSVRDNPRDQRNYSKVEHRFLGEDEVRLDADGAKRGPAGEELYDWLHTDDGQGMVLSQQIEMTGDFISSARALVDPEHPGQYLISFTMTPFGSLIFQRVTSTNIKHRLAIVLDGKLKSAPVIQNTISHQGQITGNFTREEAESLEVVLKDSLKTQVEVEYENTVGPTLGEDSIRQSVIAVLCGFAAVLLFMIIYYRVAGVITDLILGINMLLITGLLSAFDATLTLPGIAGLVLTVGMAVDANVLIFERIREEREKGNGLARAIQLGYERAFVTIIDANVTTFFTAVILDQFGTEAVRGFAKTMIIGIICSVFTSLVLTRWCFEALLAWGWIKEVKMLKFFNHPHFPFSKVRRVAMLVSLLFIVVGMAVFVARGKKNLAQDFTGGMLAQISLAEPMTMGEARAIVTRELKPLFTDIDIQSFGQAQGGKNQDFIVRTARLKDTSLPEGAEANKGLHSAAELRAMLEKVFALQKNGLEIAPEAVADKSTTDVKVFKGTLSLKNNAGAARRPAAALKTILEGNTTLKKLEVLDNPDGSYTVYAGLPLVSPEGEQRVESDLVPLIRDQLQRLRDLGVLDFTEPFPRFNNVGSAVADEMISSAIGALLFAMILIFVYLWLRFQFRASFGAAAVIALAHDVLFCLGLLAILDQFCEGFNGQISLVVIAALLTLVGYSINDTIVVFDRIREIIRTTSGQSLAQMVDTAINSTLSRTIITSITTLLVVVPLLAKGGDVLLGFSFVMFVGVVVGTYSSVFIAAPLLIEFA
ncbi:MAG: protein translocase subunit SecD, partial [Planctomycetes bacterium]|nr:protein translocase subunit SecD [Planctomycetota bacterium]